MAKYPLAFIWLWDKFKIEVGPQNLQNLLKLVAIVGQEDF